MWLIFTDQTLKFLVYLSSMYSLRVLNIKIDFKIYIESNNVVTSFSLS